MDEHRARRVADALRDRGVNAHLLRGDGQYGVRVTLPGGREAEWDTDGTAGLEAQVMRDGMLVGYVPQIEARRTSTSHRSLTPSPAPTTTGRSPACATTRPRRVPPSPAMAVSSAASWTASATGKSGVPNAP